MGLGGMSKYMDLWMDADVDEKNRILQLMKDTAGMGETMTRTAGMQQQIGLREVEEKRKQQLFGPKLKSEKALAGQETTRAATMGREESEIVEANQAVRDLLSLPPETLARFSKALGLQEEIDISKAKAGLDFAPTEARRQVGEAKLGAARAEAGAEILPVQQRIERQLLEMKPTGVSLDMQMKSEQIQTAISVREPNLKLLDSQAKYYDAQAAKATNANQEANYRNLKTFYELLWTIEANEYAKVKHGKSIEQLKVDEIAKGETLTDQQVISFYLSAIDKQARMTDPFLLFMMQQMGMDPAGINVASKDLAAFATTLKPEFEAAVKRLGEQTITPPPETAEVVAPTPPEEGQPKVTPGTEKPGIETEESIDEQIDRIMGTE